eukprot:jgi/Bigna1/66525/fgenesh1_pg.1_\
MDGVILVRAIVQKDFGANSGYFPLPVCIQHHEQLEDDDYLVVVRTMMMTTTKRETDTTPSPSPTVDGKLKRQDEGGEQGGEKQSLLDFLSDDESDDAVTAQVDTSIQDSRIEPQSSASVEFTPEDTERGSVSKVMMQPSVNDSIIIFSDATPSPQRTPIPISKSGTWISEGEAKQSKKGKKSSHLRPPRPHFNATSNNDQRIIRNVPSSRAKNQLGRRNDENDDRFAASFDSKMAASSASLPPPRLNASSSSAFTTPAATAAAALSFAAGGISVIGGAKAAATRRRSNRTSGSADDIRAAAAAATAASPPPPTPPLSVPEAGEVKEGESFYSSRNLTASGEEGKAKEDEMAAKWQEGHSLLVTGGDVKKARSLLSEAAFKGHHPLAARTLAERLHMGKTKGLPRDLTMAAKLWEIAAQRGDKSSQYNLGMSLVFGWGVEPDRGKGKKWLRKAARQQHKHAMLKLANLLANELIEDPPPPKAIRSRLVDEMRELCYQLGIYKSNEDYSTVATRRSDDSSSAITATPRITTESTSSLAMEEEFARRRKQEEHKQRVEKRLEELRGQLERQKELVEESKLRAAALEKAAGTLREQAKQLRSENSLLAEKGVVAAATEKERGQLEGRLASAVNERDRLSEVNRRALQGARDETKAIIAENRKLSSQNDDLVRKLAQAGEKMREGRTAMEEMGQKSDKQHLEVEKHRTDNARLHAELERYREQSLKQQANLDEKHRKENDRLLSDVEKYRLEAERLAQKLTHKSKQLLLVEESLQVLTAAETGIAATEKKKMMMMTMKGFLQVSLLSREILTAVVVSLNAGNAVQPSSTSSPPSSPIPSRSEGDEEGGEGEEGQQEGASSSPQATTSSSQSRIEPEECKEEKDDEGGRELKSKACVLTPEQHRHHHQQQQQLEEEAQLLREQLEAANNRANDYQGKYRAVEEEKRSAEAAMQLCVQKLCKEHEEKEGELRQRIKSLEKAMPAAEGGLLSLSFSSSSTSKAAPGDQSLEEKEAVPALKDRLREEVASANDARRAAENRLATAELQESKLLSKLMERPFDMLRRQKERQRADEAEKSVLEEKRAVQRVEAEVSKVKEKLREATANLESTSAALQKAVNRAEEVKEEARRDAESRLHGVEAELAASEKALRTTEDTVQKLEAQLREAREEKMLEKMILERRQASQRERGGGGQHSVSNALDDGSSRMISEEEIMSLSANSLDLQHQQQQEQDEPPPSNVTQTIVRSTTSRLSDDSDDDHNYDGGDAEADETRGGEGEKRGEEEEGGGGEEEGKEKEKKPVNATDKMKEINQRMLAKRRIKKEGEKKEDGLLNDMALSNHPLDATALVTKCSKGGGREEKEEQDGQKREALLVSEVLKNKVNFLTKQNHSLREGKELAILAAEEARRRCERLRRHGDHLMQRLQQAEFLVQKMAEQR